MQSDDATEPVHVQELKHKLDEWAAIASRMIELLHETQACERSQNWRPHCDQIVNAVRSFGERCRDEAGHLHPWRADGLEPDDVFDSVRNDGERLVDWLQRMMAE